MTRLLLVTTVPYTLRAFLFPLTRHFRANGWQVDAACNGATTAADCVAEFDGVFDINWERSPLARSNFLTAPREIHDLVMREKYDIVHVTTPIAGFVTRCALRNLRKAGGPAVIYSVHGFHFHPLGNPVTNRVYTSMEKLAGRYTDVLVVTNAEDERAALEKGIVPRERLRYITGVGVDAMDCFNPANVAEQDIARIRAELSLAEDDALFLMAAEFNPGKRHCDAIRALAMANQKCRAHLALTSAGPLEMDMRGLAEQLGVQEKVHFLGFRRDFCALVRASCAMILPSIREGLPRSIMDSLSLEVPVIGCKIRGTSELLEDGCGLLCPPKDPAALAKAMIWMAEHKDEAREMGRKGRKKMLGPYELANILTAHETLYDEALSRIAAYTGPAAISGKSR